MTRPGAGVEAGTSVRELRQFARTMAIALVVIFGLALPWLWNGGFPAWPWLLALVFLGVGQLQPLWLAPVQHYWLKFGHALGWVNSRIILTIVYYLLFTPIALVLRACGRRPLDVKNRTGGESYRLPARDREDSHFERPF